MNIAGALLDAGLKQLVDQNRGHEDLAHASRKEPGMNH
jgi:hypothetical protein